MNMRLLMIWPYQIVLFIVAILGLFLLAFTLLMRKEKKLNFFLWLILIIVIPIFGPLTYIANYFYIKKSSINQFHEL
ncbi:hypothetical protein ZPR_3715 [Zunongwangia profunda SM-A87]|uniref:Cardiolipin synthase N-terminal domain-containing protein n=2 Tax=Zunongwangia profunda TaxID=398743 RepID=D5BL99_ZUNPS|nr:hypothetical protein ZPR_3715 [Zunongwangia profunda SM-A87]HCV80786.1 hypothetical protein [Zunongwangia profunda]|tara:strand:- start:335 stop:565 length:231 start_codon:yes stop_codon:yes gene_type:complete